MDPATAEEAKKAKQPTGALEKVDGECKFTIQRRNKPEEKKEAYIMMNNKYLMTCKASVTDKYLDVINTIQDELSTKKILPSAEAARNRLKELLA